ncbi:MAG: GNAT family N-acetyltransferase [Bacteroidia bacterium]|nr:GNAT family N-acetyltransferase [Bacteroidia bacterium]
MNWIVEKGTEADAGTIAAFQMDMALESEGTLLDKETLLKGVSAGLSDPAKGTYYLIRTDDGGTAGSLFLTKEWSDWNNCWYWWIQSVFIRPQYRRLGAFTCLYETVRRLALEEGSACLRLYVDRGNAKAQNCYRKQGMDECHYLMYEETL